MTPSEVSCSDGSPVEVPDVPAGVFLAGVVFSTLVGGFLDAVGVFTEVSSLVVLILLVDDGAATLLVEAS